MAEVILTEKIYKLGLIKGIHELPVDAYILDGSDVDYILKEDE